MIPSRVTALWLSALTLGASLGAAAPHPLDPLSAPEIGAVRRAILADPRFPVDGLFAEVSLREPAKEAVLAARPVPREAFAILYSRKQDKTWEATVDVTDPAAPRIRAWEHVPGIQPVYMHDDEAVFYCHLNESEEWKAALQKRKIHPQDVKTDFWVYGWSDQARPRSFRAVPYFRGEGDNYYSRPIEGLEAVVDLVHGKVEVIDTWDGEPVPPESPEFDEERIREAHGLRAPLKPLQITQPDGPEFTTDGQEVRWQNWRFRWQMHPRSGLVLHQVRYVTKENGKEKERSILYRGSLSEMAVPYGDPRASWAWRSAFDLGDYDVGHLAAALRKGLDVPENAQLFGALFAGNDGRPWGLDDVVAIYERDGGLLWRHADNARRGRELVLFSVSTVGNYDYGISWIFKQDGSMEVETALTGMMLAKAVKDGHHDPYSHQVAPNVAAVHHQHVLSFRLDMDVDGPANSVYSMNSFSKDPQPPYYNTFVMEETAFEREREACQTQNMATARTWRVGHRAAGNGGGGHAGETGYILVPGSNSLPLLDERAPNRQRGRFMDCHLWVTRYAPRELYAAGDYPNQSTGSKGLPEWTQANRKIRDEDVVLWYTLNVTHVPRPEEWPVMTTSRYGFKLVPAGFFPRNPALDVPLPQ
ncbi:MAG TPA: primary-amine oxidase [Thermoanaerobaculia bacterium]|nr:primary-amine oxidase [Thermoanaerobaculia bacterium]